MAEQCGVVCRAQVLALGHDDSFIEARLRRKDWARVHRGVYVDHTGPLTEVQRIWAACLFYGEPDGRAAACAESTLTLHGIRAAGDRVHVAVPQERRVTGLPGVQVHRLTDFAEAVHPGRRPLQVRLERAVVQVACAARDDAAAVAVVSDACRSRRTTAGRVASTLRPLTRARRRAFLLAVLNDVASGVQSVLEHRYLTHVERPHGLPRADRQRRDRGPRGTVWRDAAYLGGRLLLELDGRIGHDADEDRWDDLERDLAAATGGATTVRLGWRQVLSPCRLALAVARLLQELGWTGQPRPCGPDCLVPAGDTGDLSAPGAGRSPLSR
jgi:hypothetical protein